MLKELKHDGKIIAIIFKTNYELKEGHNFLTDSKESLQVNVINEREGYVIQNHIHNSVKREIVDTQEMLYVERGKMKVKFMAENGVKIDEEILNQGDLVVLLRGGHGFEFLRDSKIIYVKQGPYVGKEVDKRELK